MQTPVYDEVTRHRFQDMDDLIYGEEYYGIKIHDMRLYICEPEYGSRLLDTFFDFDAEQFIIDIPQAFTDALKTFNAAILAFGPVDWIPGPNVPIFPKSYLELLSKSKNTDTTG